MAWPLSQDYNEAVQNPQLNFRDAELKQGQPAVNRLGLPLVMSGNFADVYRIHCPVTKRDWAVKCFTREVFGLQDRYREISSHLRQARLAFTVEFSYLAEGIRIRGEWFPVLKMQWVDGTTLNSFVNDNLHKPSALEALAQLWIKLAQLLRDAGLAHADLQHGNVLLVPAGNGGHKLKLIDYDGMFVPTLARSPSGEVGHPNYQHPLRLKYGLYNAEVDRFPHLVIGCALRSLALGGRALWDRYDNSDNLLFRQKDFDEPHRSALFKELWQSRDPLTRVLAGHLVRATRCPLGQEPFLPDIVSNGQPPTLSPAEEQHVAAILKGSGSAGTGKVVPTPPVAGTATAGRADEVVYQAWLAPTLPIAGTATTSPAWMSQASISRPGPTVAPRFPVARTVPPPTKPQWQRIGLIVAIFAIGVMLYSALPLSNPTRVVSAPQNPTPVVSAPQNPTPVVSAPQNPTPVDFTNSIGMGFKLIPAGSFTMGSNEGNSAESPAKQRTITRPFYLDIYEVTQTQYELVMQKNPSNFKNPTYPVEQVSWDDAVEFCRRLSELPREKSAGRVYRLPTEAEWEYAARAGSTGKWCIGDDESQLGDSAWYRTNSGSTTHPVGQKKPNAWGLFDMHGNVWEWCQDWYDSDYYARAPNAYPLNSDRGSNRVSRGGSWDDSAAGCRSAFRDWIQPTDRIFILGFRVALVPSSQQASQ